MKDLTKEEKLIKIVRWLLLFEGILFLVFSGVHFFRGIWVLAVLLFIDAVIFLWLNRVIEKKRKWIFWFAVVFIGVNIFSTIASELGWSYFFVLVLDSVLFVMILGNRKYLVNR
ncbi:MAG: hypothetical protein PF549_01980 [Patescibacteria group bacterium]|jgi:hypothetical protein|nr:hypothetical protein [Patescibacteria group bacterium]